MHTNPTSPLLQLQNLQISYGGIQAVKGIDLDLWAGELVCLIGANGAGKTTTLNAIAGVLPLAGGDILYAGDRMNTVPAHKRLRKGIALVPEGRGIFTRLTVEENLRMGAYTRNDKAGIEADLERVYTMLPRVKERLHQVAGTLSGGEQQMVAIGRALLSRPKLLLLDEPSMGLAPLVVEKIFEVVQSVAREGVTILLVEQNANLALEFAQRGYVMESGKITLTGTGEELLADPKVREAYLGEIA
ncbi:MAG: ABC transporter ATP-binding protein [Thauera propionica]|jgi:branched-chain amino acid transport system ATP-binding protein|uniref:ABC transporter ATP-binding protein n=1 Tax=Thauera propionica TaxID=2019431 RepID=A0A235F337_9RHOO|nr:MULTISPECIES: ABC transporter ATP-binding protein [Thauera]MDD3676828.1 ABC transporter ATP-binding protein [Thauera propionica]MDI3491604.1 branched-chain amino acid transport system ATP-binding protein [Thauera sp.]MDY0048380.1 ABC transporter ATP-binding protein [Thauera propionica]OYD55317.1 ABC transporter ATP-binding protein [Thauera propionica]